jgi:hypothetical protein
VGDIDGDKDLEIALGTLRSYVNNNEITIDNRIYIFNSDGSLVPGWPVETPANLYPYDAPPALADLNNDGFLEIIIGSIKRNATTGIPVQDPYPHGGILAYYYNGTFVEGFPYYNNEWNWALATADINNDWTKEILTHDELIDSHGKLIWEIGEGVASFLAVSDINKDNYPEIIYGTFLGKVRVRNYNGSLIKGWENVTVGSIVDGNPVVGDINGDGLSEVFIGTYQQNMLYGWYSNGTSISGFPKVNSNDNRNLAIADLDDDGNLELISAGNYIYVYSFNKRYTNISSDWPQFQHDAQHTGCYDCDKSANNLICGDVSSDGLVDISDVMAFVDYLFFGMPMNTNPMVANMNRDNTIDISDFMILIDYLFLNGPVLQCSSYANVSSNPTKGWTYQQVLDYINKKQASSTKSLSSTDQQKLTTIKSELQAKINSQSITTAKTTNEKTTTQASASSSSSTKPSTAAKTSTPTATKPSQTNPATTNTITSSKKTSIIQKAINSIGKIVNNILGNR